MCNAWFHATFMIIPKSNQKPHFKCDVKQNEFLYWHAQMTLSVIIKKKKKGNEKQQLTSFKILEKRFFCRYAGTLSPKCPSNTAKSPSSCPWSWTNLATW